MEKNKTHIFGKKSIILAAVSLVLVIITATGITTSWIEEVSQVEFSSTNGQETPLHVGEKALKAEAVMKNNPTPQVVELRQYFYESGDMHLSPCYSDGEKFYFPVQGITADDEEEEISFREGTKDDANVNYLSATFKIKSEGANTAYWFEKSTGVADYIAFKKGANTTNNTALHDYLRCSVTIDGVTNVYALNSTGKFHTLASSSATSATEKDGRRMDQYSYYAEAFNNSSPEGYYKNPSANVENKPNQGAGNNLNGNTLFNVPQYNGTDKTGVKTVTVKIWLEYAPSLSTCGFVDVASVNMNLVSSWAKTRRIYVKDATEYQDGYSNAKWLSNQSAKLYFALKDDLDKRWQLKRVSNTDYYYIDTNMSNNADDDLPAVYNNMEVVLLRCGPSGPGSNSNNQHDYTNNGKTVYCWDKWETTFPDTFHSEIFTVCTNVYGTWDLSPSKVYFLNSCSFQTPKAYMWDINSVHGDEINDKVVKNANWPGVNLTKLHATVSGANYYTFYYNADYSNIIFSDGLAHGGNWEHQTQDINQVQNVEGKTFDMTSLMWYTATPSSPSTLPTYANFTQTYIDTSLATGHNDYWTHLNLCYGGNPSSSSDKSKFNGTNADNLLCRFYSKYGASGDDYDLHLVLHVGNKVYKDYAGHGKLDVNSGSATRTLYEAGGNNTEDLVLKNVAAHAIYSIYVKKVNNGYDVTLQKDT